MIINTLILVLAACGTNSHQASSPSLEEGSRSLSASGAPNYPNVPVNPFIIVENNVLRVNNHNPTQVDYYHIQRSSQLVNPNFETIALNSEGFYIDQQALPGITYAYRVIPIFRGVAGTISNIGMGTALESRFSPSASIRYSFRNNSSLGQADITIRIPDGLTAYSRIRILNQNQTVLANLRIANGIQTYFFTLRNVVRNSVTNHLVQLCNQQATQCSLSTKVGGKAYAVHIMAQLDAKQNLLSWNFSGTDHEMGALIEALCGDAKEYRVIAQGQSSRNFLVDPIFGSRQNCQFRVSANEGNASYSPTIARRIAAAAINLSIQYSESYLGGDYLLSLSPYEAIHLGFAHVGSIRIYASNTQDEIYQYRNLYRCHETYSGLHFPSLDANCEGQTVDGLLGSLRITATSTSAVPLYRYYRDGRHCTTTQPKLCAGGVLIGILGFGE